jgi:hypothetical protein
VIEIAENDNRNAYGEALRRGVQRRALEKAPGMTKLGKGELEAAAANLEGALAGLDLVDGEVRAWGEQHWGRAVREIVAERGPATPEKRADPWFPLRNGDRLVLGEATAQRLLGEAAYLTGRADVDPELARAVGQSDRTALEALRKPVERVEKAAEATAAANELSRRQLFESARARAAAGEVTSVEVATTTRNGWPAKAPIERNRSALGRRGDSLQRHSAALSEELNGMDDATLQNVAGAIENPWPELRPGVAFKQGSLERDRDVATVERLKAMRQIGKLEQTLALGGGEEGRQEFEMGVRIRTGKHFAKEKWNALREIDSQLEQQLEKPGNVDDFVQSHPEAAVHDAVQAELLTRARAVEKVQESAGAARQQEVAEGVDVEIV